jgi:hypothetical protein
MRTAAKQKRTKRGKERCFESHAPYRSDFSASLCNFQSTSPLFSHIHRCLSAIRVCPLFQRAPCFNVSLWWQSTLTGMGLTLLCSIFLVKIARAYQRQANPTKVFSTEGSAEAEPNK